MFMMHSRLPVPVRRKDQNNNHSRTLSAPTKLERLKAEYQAHLQQDKARKLSILQFESRQVEKHNASLGYNETYQKSQSDLAKDFHNERMNLEQVKQKKNMPRRASGPRKFQNVQSKTNTGKAMPAARPPLPPHMVQKRSAGRDKSNPLAPIEHSSMVRRESPASPMVNGMVSPHTPKPPAFGPRAHRFRGRRASSGYNTPVDSENDESLPSNRPALIPIRNGQGLDRVKKLKTDSHQDMTGDNRSKNKAPLPKNQLFERRSPEKVTDFQKWQQHQNKEREDRLRRHREENKPMAMDRDDVPPSNRSRGMHTPTSNRATSMSPASSRPSSDVLQKMSNLLKKQKAARENFANSRLTHRVSDSEVEDMSYDDTSDDDEEESDMNTELQRKQEQLMKLLQQQQAELDSMQKKRETEEQEETMEAEMRKKRQAAQRQRLRSLNRADSSDLLDEDEADNYGSSKSQFTPEPPSSRRGSASGSSRRGRYRSATRDRQTPVDVAPKPPKAPKKAKPQPRQPTPDNANTAFYVDQLAELPDATADGGVVLAPCPSCGRNFAEDRLAKHVKVCKQTAQKKRKVFDPIKMRNDGTENANYVAHAARSAPKTEKPKKNNWKTQHESFIKSIRYAKKVAEVEAAGGNVADLPPPPPSENPDYVQCPHCTRRFNPHAADRHIPRCKNLKSRPAPPKAKRR